MGKEYAAGISSYGDCGQLAVFELRKQERRLVHLEEFPRSEGKGAWFLDPLVRPKTRILKKVSKVSVSLGDDALIFHSFPIDASLTQPEQNEHIHWELANVVPEYRARDHVFDVHVLRSRARDQVAEILVVAVMRSLIFEIQSVASARGIELDTVDSNYFAAERAFLFNYPEMRQRCALLVAAGERKMHFGVVQNGRTVAYETTEPREPEEAAARITSNAQAGTPDGVYVCGPGAGSSFVGALKGLSPIPVTQLNPFRRIADAAEIPALEKFAGVESQLASCAGIALQRP